MAAHAAAWWLDSHLPGEAFVVTSAPTFPQVRAILWREIGRLHARSGLPGRVNQTEWFLPVGPNEELVAFGRKPADVDPAAFQGIHARYVLVIFDEATGIPSALWEAADSSIANEFSRFLAIGNPDDPASEFAGVCKPGSGWNVIPISAFDTPNFTDEQVPEDIRHVLISPVWVDEKHRKWGEQNPLWTSKVLGQFPEVSEDTLIPPSWIRAAQERMLEPGEPNELGVDVGGGRDRSVICHRRGSVVRIIAADQNPDTMATCGNVLRHLSATGAELAKVDHVGIGRGVVDRAKEQRRPVYGVNVGERAKTAEGFANLRAELYWGLRERFQAGDIDLDPNDDDLAAELAGLKFKTNSRGQIIIESKDDMRARGLSSPDRADAVMLALASSEMLGLGRPSIRGRIAFV